MISENISLRAVPFYIAWVGGVEVFYNVEGRGVQKKLDVVGGVKIEMQIE